MLRFAVPPDKAFQCIVTAAIEMPLGLLEDPYVDDNMAMCNCCEQIRTMFTRQSLLEQLEALLQAHQDNALYMPSEYHFLILYDILDTFVEVHNDTLGLDGISCVQVGDVMLGEIDFDWIEETYFWDTDFLTPPETMDQLTAGDKEMTGYSPGTFGIVHGLVPHPDELILKQAEPSTEPFENRNHYQEGQAYPYYAPEN